MCLTDAVGDLHGLPSPDPQNSNHGGLGMKMSLCLCLVSQHRSPGFGLSQVLCMDGHTLAHTCTCCTIPIFTSPATNIKEENQHSSLCEDGLECCTVHLTFLLHPSFSFFIPVVITRKLALVSTLSCCLEFPFCKVTFSVKDTVLRNAQKVASSQFALLCASPRFPKEFEQSWDYRALFVCGLKACVQVHVCETEGELPVTDEWWQWQQNSVLHPEQPILFVTLQDKASGDNAQRGTEAAAFSQAFWIHWFCHNILQWVIPIKRKQNQDGFQKKNTFSLCRLAHMLSTSSIPFRLAEAALSHTDMSF